MVQPDWDLLNAIPDPAVVVDREGIIRFANRHVQSLLGYTREDLAGRSVELLIPDTLRQSHLEHRKGYLTAPRVRPMGAGLDLRAIRSDGSEIPVEISLSPMESPDGLVIVATIRDISDRKRKEAERLQSVAQQAAREESQLARRRLEFVAAASQVLFSSLDYDQTLSSVASLAVPYLADWCVIHLLEESGHARQVAVAHTDPAKVAWARQIQEKYPPNRDAPRGLYHVLRTGQPELYQQISDEVLAASARDEEHLRLLRQVGFSSAIVVPMALHERTLGAITLVAAESGRKYSSADLTLAQDLALRSALAVENSRLFRQAQTWNAELEQRVKERTAELEEALKELETFSYTVSHDLRSPLRSIDGFSLAVLEDFGERLNDTGREYLHRIRAASQRMSDLIDALLRLSRIMTSIISSQSVDLTAMARQIASELRETALQRTVNWRIQDGLTAVGDPRLLRVVLFNLLENSWKFTAPRSTPVIEFGSLPGPSPPVFYVRDNGVGFDMAHSSKLFQPFQRLHRVGEFDGTGIGLATVFRVIRRHSGRIWAEGSPGEGATFYFTL